MENVKKKSEINYFFGGGEFKKIFWFSLFLRFPLFTFQGENDYCLNALGFCSLVSFTAEVKFLQLDKD